MILCVLEYYEPISAGTVVAVVNQISDLPDLIKDPHHPLVLDEGSCSWFKVLKSIGKAEDLITFAKAARSLEQAIEHALPSFKQQWHERIISAFKQENNYEEGGIILRVDWALWDFMQELKNGLYLVETIPVSDNELPRIVSHTYRRA